MLTNYLLVYFYLSCLLSQAMENMSRIDDLLILKLFQSRDKFFIRSACRLTTSFYNLTGHYFISVWFAVRVQQLKSWSDICRTLLQCVLCPSSLGNHREGMSGITPWKCQVSSISCWKEGITCLFLKNLKMYKHSSKTRLKYTTLFQRWGCVLCLWILTPLHVWQ